jgi:hypothetical protein
MKAEEEKKKHDQIEAIVKLIEQRNQIIFNQGGVNQEPE